MFRLIFSIIFSMFIGGMIGGLSGAENGALVGLGITIAMIIKSIFGYNKRKKEAEVNALYRAGCQICGVPFGKKVYTVTVNGVPKLACSSCGNSAKRAQSKRAMKKLLEGEDDEEN